MSLRRLLRAFDRWLARTQGVFEFSQDPDCILRLQLSQARRPRTVAGIALQPGDRVLMIHLWNERLREVPETGADLAWARAMHFQFLHSLRLAARYIEGAPALADLRAIGAETILSGALGRGGGHILQSLGFTPLPHHCRLATFGLFWENFYSWLLLWAYNPASLGRKSFWRLQRLDFWMPADAFLRYVKPPEGSGIPTLPKVLAETTCHSNPNLREGGCT